MGVLLMLLTIGGLFLAVLLMIVAGVTRQVWLAKFVFGAVGVWFAVYAVLLATVSFFSVEKTLNLNEPKAFCGFYLDCHLHAAVTDVRKTKTFGNKTADGEFYVVRVKIFSDARRAEPGLHAPEFEVVDGNGSRFKRLADLEKPEPFWDTKVPAGGSFEKEAVFDLPENVSNPRLDVSEGAGVEKGFEMFLIGDEDSLWHKRTLFRL
ncbi:MAG TPA: hypothetical protein VEQ34_02715 [Pyrinomonadaceae bacterium]|nr:hypothetical protein [Pyrinomonadaceae bacterium]